MRILILICLLVFLPACANKSPPGPDSVDYVQKTGRIIGKEFIEIDAVEESGLQVNPSIFASIFSGGRISLGVGFLFRSEDSGVSTEIHVRYEIKMLDDSELVIISQSQGFEIGDCVETIVYKNVEKNPPQLKHKKGGCDG